MHNINALESGYFNSKVTNFYEHISLHDEYKSGYPMIIVIIFIKS